MSRESSTDKSDEPAMGLSQVKHSISHGTSRAGPLVTDRTLLGLFEDWERLLLSSEERRSRTLRKRTRTGRPAGDAGLVARVEQITAGPERRKTWKT